MGWRESLQKASFRGVPFSVDGHEGQFGRRVQVHEYPLRDVPFAEDLGRKARTLKVEALILGADYMVGRNALLAAVEKAGPGTLVHPYLGELQVTLITCSLHETTAEGGLCRFALEFVEAGEDKFPSTVVSTGAAVAAAGDAATVQAVAVFGARHQAANKPAFVANASGTIFKQALAGIQGAVGKVRAAADQVAALQRDVDAARRDLVTLIYTPASAAQALLSNIRQLVRSVATTPRDALSLARTLYDFGSLLPVVLPSTTSRKAQAINQAQLVQLVRVVAAAEGARAAAGVAFDSFQDAIATRDELVDTLEAVMLSSDVADQVYQALRTLRAAVVRDVAARGADLARLVAYTPRATVPSLVLAQSLYADALREPDLLARNTAIRHPLFVPGSVPIEVLADG